MPKLPSLTAKGGAALSSQLIAAIEKQDVLSYLLFGLPLC
jgi:hypothetical protein